MGSDLATLLEYLKSNGLLISNHLIVTLLGTVVVLFVAKSVVDILLSKNNVSGSQASNVKTMLDLELSFAKRRETFKQKRTEFSSSLENSKSLASESLKSTYVTFNEFLIDYSEYLISYLFMRKHGYKNKIQFAVLRDDVYECLHLYQLLYELFQSYPNLQSECPFAFSQVKPLFLFVDHGIKAKIQNHVLGRKLLKIRGIGRGR